MAVSQNSYFSNSIVGQPQIGADIDIFDSTSNPKYTVGLGFTRGDGNKYRYCHFGLLTPAGNLVATDVSESGRPKTENLMGAFATLVRQGNELMLPGETGSRYMQFTITATADQYAGGYIAISTGSGSGYTYHIRGNDATAAQITGQTIINLYESIASPISPTSDILLAGNPYANLEPVTAVDPVAVGVAVTGNTISNYGWICTHGIHGVLQDVSIGSIGNILQVSSNTAGAVMSTKTIATSAAAIALYPVVGYIVEAGSSADYTMAYLTLE